MPLLYGEGDRAFILQEEIIKGTISRPQAFENTRLISLVIGDQSIFAWRMANNTDGPGLSRLLASSLKCFQETGMVRPLHR